MPAYTVYIFYFSKNGDAIRIPFAKWKRIRAGYEMVEAFSNLTIHIAYVYLVLKKRKPDCCLCIDGKIYYFDKSGRVILDKLHYIDIFQDLDEEAGGVISLQHRKKKKDVAEKYHWKLNSQQIQAVIESVW